MTTAESLRDQNLKGAQYLNKNDYQNAANMFHSVLKADPNNAGALAGTAALLYETGNERAAYGYIQKAVQNAPRNVPQLSLAISIAVKLGLYDDAKRYAAKAYKLAPKSAAGIRAQLLYLLHTTNVKDIERLVPQFLALDKSADARLNAGVALETIGKIPEAIRIYRNGIRDVVAANSPPPQPKPAFFLEKAQNALFDIKKILDSLGVPFCLAHGTLLGIYRDGDILPGDKDIDIMIPWSVDRVWLAENLARFGCSATVSPYKLRSTNGQWCFGVNLPPDDMVIDIFFPKPENGKIWLGFARGEYVLKIPTSPFGFSKVCYKGIEFPIPNQCERHLSELYGEEWRFRTRNRKTFIINPNIVDEGHIRVAHALNHILSWLIRANYKKAQGFTEQLLSIYDDPLLYELRAYFANLPFEVALFPPLPWQERRLHYREVMGR